MSKIINTLSSQDFAGMDKFRLKERLGKIKEILVKMNKMAGLAAGSSAAESASLTLDKKRDSLESKFHRASSEKISCLQETVSLLNQCIGKENQGQLQNEKELEIHGKDFKKQMKENRSLTLKLCQEKEKLKKLNTRNINKKLNRKQVLNNRLKSENK